MKSYRDILEEAIHNAYSDIIQQISRDVHRDSSAALIANTYGFRVDNIYDITEIILESLISR